MTTATQKTISITLAEDHWDRIRSALLYVAGELSKDNSPLESEYFHTYKLIKLATQHNPRP